MDNENEHNSVFRIQWPSDVRQLPQEERREAFAILVNNENWQDSLDLRISAGLALTEPEIDACVALFGKRCQQRTKDRLRRAFAAVPDIPSYEIYKRVLFHGECVEYCAGQSYPDEVRIVRKCLIG